jgi:hypothetical protein
MGFYLLPEECHKKMKSVRSKFFWRGAEDKFKYHMVRWDVVLWPREFGGLGILNTQVLNDCMMAKWIWKLYQQKGGLMARLLRAKYMRHGDFFRSKGAGDSQFWKSLHKIKHLFKWGAIHSVGNGWFTKFWDDVWLVNAPLRIQFTKLYETCVDKQAMVAEYAARDWHIQFQRMLSLEAQAEWEGLQGMLQCVSLAQEDDRISWGLTTSKRFSTSSLYKFLTSWGVNNSTAKRIWKCRVHLKIRVFLWQVFQNRILIAQQFCARN